MSRIFITGDTHGTFNNIDPKFHPILKGTTKKDYLIVAGDFGFIWNEKSSFRLLKKVNAVCPCTVLFVDGNHENFDLLLNRKLYPVKNKFGGKVSEVSNHVFHLQRGEIYTINSKTFFCLGGATSVDKVNRIENVSWWKEENLSQQDIDNALNNLAKHNNKVNYIVTHAGPSSLRYALYGQTMMYYHEGHSAFLNEIQQTVEFDMWFTGHYHEDTLIQEKYQVLYETVIEIN